MQQQQPPQAATHHAKTLRRFAMRGAARDGRQLFDAGSWAIRCEGYTQLWAGRGLRSARTRARCAFLMRGLALARARNAVGGSAGLYACPRAPLQVAGADRAGSQSECGAGVPFVVIGP